MKCERDESRPLEFVARKLSNVVDRNNLWSISTEELSKVIYYVSKYSFKYPNGFHVFEHNEMTKILTEKIRKKSITSWKHLHIMIFHCLNALCMIKSTYLVVYKMGTINMSGWAVERWDPLTAHINVCSMQSSIWAVGQNHNFLEFLPLLILMIA